MSHPGMLWVLQEDVVSMGDEMAGEEVCTNTFQV